MGEKYCVYSSYFGAKAIFYYFTIPRHWIWVTRNRKECRYENIHPENISRVLWVRDNYTIKDGRKIIVSIIHTGRARAIFYYFVIPRHWIWVIRKEKYCSSTNIHEQNKTKGSAFSSNVKCSIFGFLCRLLTTIQFRKTPDLVDSGNDFELSSLKNIPTQVKFEQNMCIN